MGGYGSGCYYRFSTPRNVTSSYLRLDIRKLHREGFLIPGRASVCQWSRGHTVRASISLAVSGSDKADVLTLSYCANHEPVEEQVRLEWTPCNYGGERPWTLCLRCWRRVAVLYGGRRFLCRHCYDLAYQSTREDAPSRRLSKAQTIRQRLGGSANMFEPFPPKPKGMHWRTYWRLLEEAEEASIGAMIDMLASLERRLSKHT